MKAKKLVLALAISGVTLAASQTHAAETFTEALTSGKASGDIRIRYEQVEIDPEDNLIDEVDSEGLTVRTRIGYKTGEVNGFSAFVEFEDVTDMLGIDDDNNLIPDPEVTEIDQAFLQLKNDVTTFKVGRQVITLDGHRHIGHVGWRQDRQTFDAVRAQFTPAKGLSIDLSHIYQRNRIFGEDLDAKSSDFLLNIGYKTPVGKVTGYGYLLDDEARDEQSDTYGVSFVGKAGSDSLKWLYAFEYATQSITDSGAEFDTDYTFAELGFSASGVTAKIGYEVLGSDDGGASFTTPLATLHKFNGWADVFLGGTFNPTAMPNGLEDTYLFVGGKVAGVKLAAIYHEFSANEGSDDYGSEIDFVASKGFGKNYYGGVKYAAYQDDGFRSSDVNKIWLWVGAKF